MNPTSAIQKFILHWGEIGAHWGMNRTVAQIHALLLVSDKALTADEIKVALDIARSNVSISIKELLNWNLIKTLQQIGDRKTRYEAVKSSTQIFQLILQKRKEREVDPAIVLMDDCLKEVRKSGQMQAHHQINELAQTLKKMSSLMDEFMNE